MLSVDGRLKASHLYNEKISMTKFQDNYKDSVSQILGVLVSRLKAVKNTMGFSLLFFS